MSQFVTPTGFQKKTLPELKAEYEGLFQTAFGADVDLDSRGPIGQIIALLAKRDADLWDGAQEIYTSRDPSSATGQSLDAIARETGVFRIGPAPTTAEAVFRGDDGTVVAEGKLARREGGVNFRVSYPVTIDRNDAVEALLSFDEPEDGKLYSITVNASPYTYTATSTDTLSDVFAGLALPGERDGDTWLLRDGYAVFGLGVLVGASVEWVGSIGHLACVEDGALSLPAGSLREIVTPVSGWLGIYNPAPGSLGREAETDAELRIRREQSLLTGRATEESIRQGLLNRVSGITSVSVTSNRTLDWVDGLPPKSFEAIVAGGDHNDIASELWELMPAGIEDYGNINADGTTSDPSGSGVSVPTSWGGVQTIHFSRPAPLYLWVKVERSLYDEELYPTTGDAQIKEAIVKWGQTEYTLGKDIIRQRLAGPVYTVPGVGEIRITVDASTDPSHTPTFQATNIAVPARQYAVPSVGRIVVRDL